MKPGTVCSVVGDNFCHSLYRDKNDFDRYFWAGLTPGHSHGALSPKTRVVFLEEVVWDGERLSKILPFDDERCFFIQSHFLHKV